MDIQVIASAFQTSGSYIAHKPFGHGHINSTFKVTTNSGCEYVLQKINKYVFKNPIWVMENIAQVTNFLRERSGDPTATLHYLPARDGRYFVQDTEGEFWRMYDYVGGFSLDLPETEADFYESAVAFGRFQELLSDFPADTLHEIIPNFHNTIDRYRKLRNSIAADNVGRCAGVKEDLNFLLEREELGGTLQRMLDNKELPLRVTHNDTKLNNVLFDKKTRKGRCVIDLDTVMPGLSLYDFGDSIRFGAATAAEDEQDTSKMKLDLHLFQVYTQGFLDAARSLTAAEVKMLPMGALIMTLECGVRFMTDYLDGDLYFRIAYPEHNLVRARTQMALVADMQAKWEEMNGIVAQEAAKRGWVL